MSDFQLRGNQVRILNSRAAVYVQPYLISIVKHIDPEKHKALTGKTNENILDMARYLSDINKPIWIRHVLVPGINSDEESLTKLHEFISTLNNVYRIDVP